LGTVSKDRSHWTDWALLIALSLTWGSSFILIKKALVAFNEVEVASLRIAISTLISIPIVIYYFKQIEWRKWHYFLIVGLVGNGLPPFLFAAAQTEVNSSLAGVLNTLTPIFTLIFAILFFNQKLNWKNSIGVLIGLAGTILIAYAGKTDFEGGMFYISLIIIATVLYALNINAVKFFFKSTKPILIIAVSFVLFGPFSFFILGSESFVHTVQNDPFAFKSLMAIAVLASLSTILATMYFFRLLQRTNTVFASSVSYVIPLKGFTPKIGNNCFIAETAMIIGEVEIGDNCSIWYNAILRGDVGLLKMGNECNIQDGAILHATTGVSETILGDRVSIGHNAIIHGAIVESEVLVGMGAIIMDNAIIKSNTIIAAGSIVLSNQELEGGYIYAGNPAKKVKEVAKSKAGEYIKLTPKAYQEYVEYYRKEGYGTFT